MRSESPRPERKESRDSIGVIDSVSSADLLTRDGGIDSPRESGRFFFLPRMDMIRSVPGRLLLHRGVERGGREGRGVEGVFVQIRHLHCPCY